MAYSKQLPSSPQYQRQKAQVEKTLAKQKSYVQEYRFPRTPVQPTIPEQTDARYQELQNRALEQDILLKKAAFNRLFLFLAIETVAVFVLSLLQAWHTSGFALEEWSFRLLLACTIVQITIMLSVAIKHLFPDKLDNEGVIKDLLKRILK
ncbi:MAG: hypothetical protein HY817_05810 [Candidatus Abawacabacteria bacterium]|nr:hypothetical protein [Candidatus Abawacabacteria bacterium]